jgi:DNA polymerase-3 subunit epsilon
MALRGLFGHLQLRMGELGVERLGDALRLERGLLPGMPEPTSSPVIARALGEGRALLIRYRSRGSAEATTRTVRPLYLTREAGGTYLRAYCELRQDVRSFAVAKIERIELR